MKCLIHIFNVKTIVLFNKQKRKIIFTYFQGIRELQKDQHGRDALLATYIQYQCNLPHPYSNNGQIHDSSAPMARSLSNPDMEVAQFSPRGLDRASSMRTSNTEQIGTNINTLFKTVHQQMALHWVVSSGRSKELSMQNAWFLFELIVKSMIEHLAYTRNLETPRRNRFAEQFLDDITMLVQTVTTEIISLSLADVRLAHKLNDALGFFIFDLFSIADRGYVMQLIRAYTKQMQAKISSIQDPTVLVELKLVFVRIICSHEHYVAFNLPFATPFMFSGGNVSPSPSVTSSTSQNSFLSGPPASQERASTFAELTSEYRQHHYLTGLVLTDLATVLLEIP